MHAHGTCHQDDSYCHVVLARARRSDSLLHCTHGRSPKTLCSRRWTSSCPESVDQARLGGSARPCCMASPDHFQARQVAHRRGERRCRHRKRRTSTSSSTPAASGPPRSPPSLKGKPWRAHTHELQQSFCARCTCRSSVVSPDGMQYHIYF
jgi:hypothetical protein